MNLFQRHLLAWTLLPLCVLAFGASYYRFMIADNYFVTYQGNCDPSSGTCFVSQDPNTGDTEYYTKVRKYEPDIYRECGADVTDCAAADSCLPTDQGCSVTLCSASTVLDDETCETGSTPVEAPSLSATTTP